jgi:small subunit ribosomal protein S20
VAHSLSAKKRNRQNDKRRLRNRAARSTLRSQIKKLRRALDSSESSEAQRLLPATVSLVDRLVKRGVLRKGTASRYKSRLGKRFAVMVKT